MSLNDAVSICEHAATFERVKLISIPGSFSAASGQLSGTHGEITVQFFVISRLSPNRPSTTPCVYIAAEGEK